MFKFDEVEAVGLGEAITLSQSFNEDIAMLLSYLA
jgi:hypothetical protein